MAIQSGSTVSELQRKTSSVEFAELKAMIESGGTFQQRAVALICECIFIAAGIKDFKVQQFLLDYVPTREEREETALVALHEEIQKHPERFK